MRSCHLCFRCLILLATAFVLCAAGSEAAQAVLDDGGHGDPGGPAPILAASVEIAPHVIDRGHRPSPWVTVFIEPVGFDVSSIVPSSVRLAGSVAPVGKVATVADHNRDGVPELELKFNRRDLDRYLAPGLNELGVTGSLLSGVAFAGSGAVHVNITSRPPAWILLSPNPLNPTGVLTVRTTVSGPARVELFDIRGRRVRCIADEPSLSEGVHEFRIDGRDDAGRPLATGVYLYRVSTAEGRESGRVTILK